MKFVLPFILIALVNPANALTEYRCQGIAGPLHLLLERNQVRAILSDQGRWLPWAGSPFRRPDKTYFQFFYMPAVGVSDPQTSYSIYTIYFKNEIILRATAEWTSQIRDIGDSLPDPVCEPMPQINETDSSNSQDKSGDGYLKKSYYKYLCRLNATDDPTIDIEVSSQDLRILGPSVPTADGPHDALLFRNDGLLGGRGKMKGRLLYRWDYEYSKTVPREVIEYYISPELIWGGFKLDTGAQGGYVSFLNRNATFETYICMRE